MKKFYFLFVMLLSLLGTTTAFAQDVTITVDMDNGKWVQWNGNEGNPYARTWYSTTSPAISICSKNGGYSDVKDIRGNVFNGANNMAPWGSDKKGLKFYNQYGSAGYGNYEIMVETGYFIKSVEFDFNSSVPEGTGVTLGENEEVISENSEDIQHVSMTAEDKDVYAVLFTVSQKGTNGFAQTSNFIVVVGKLGEADAAKEELSETLAQYDQYKNSFTPGTAPGLYGVDEVAAFRAAIDEAYEVDNNPDLDDMPDAERAEYFRTLAEKIRVTYEAVLASKVPMSLADGYYRIKSGMDFYKTTTVVDEETQEEETTTEHFDKYMYTVMSGETISAKWATPDDVTTDCPSLWYISNKDGHFDIRSVASDGRFVAGTNPVTLSTTSEDLLDFDAVTTTENGVTYVDIRISTENTNSYLHCGGHSSGKGDSGNIVKYRSEWKGDENFSASEWIFVPVTEEEANAIMEAYAPIKDREIMLYNYKNMLTDAKKNLEIAKDMQQVTLISETSQFSSPWTEPSEGSLDNLLDGNASTYWHSNWSDGSVSNHTHYLQVALAAPVEEDIYLSITRRPVSNDHVTLWSVYGSSDPEAEDEAWVKLDSLETPFGDNTETVKSATFSTQGYQYLRFYIDGTTTNRGYGHVSEFQLCYDAPNENAQVRFMGDLADNLEAVIKAQEGLETDDIQPEHYNALKAAYDAFMAKFVDPTELRDLLKSLKGAADVVVIGDQPGFWRDNNEAVAFNATYAAAEAYDAKGDYSPEQSKNYVETLTTLNNNFFASAIGIQTGKWYKIRFATGKVEDDEEEGEFDKYGWDKVAGNGTKDSEGNYVNEPLFGKYITVSRLDESVEDANVVVDNVEAEEFGLNSNLFFDAADDIYDEDLTMFRFIAVGDSAFLMQNKGTNLFLKAATTGAVTLSVHPSLFNVRAIGYGENVIAARSITGANQNYLHAQVSGNMLVTWNASTPGSRSGLYLEEVGNVESDYEGTEFRLFVVPNALNAFCFPMEVKAEEGQMWGVSGVDSANNGITLVKMEKAVAGRPFLYVNGDLEDYNEEEVAEAAIFTHGYEIGAKEPQTDAALKGTYTEIIIDRGDVYCSGNKLVVNAVGKDDIMVTYTRVPANGAYISAETPMDPKSELVVIWDENGVDAIQTALINVSKSGAVYTIDGRLVSKRATLNDLSNFGKGMYILNGTKVMVK